MRLTVSSHIWSALDVSLTVGVGALDVVATLPQPVRAPVANPMSNPTLHLRAGDRAALVPDACATSVRFTTGVKVQSCQGKIVNTDSCRRPEQGVHFATACRLHSP
jgi:hypothetical protein